MELTDIQVKNLISNILEGYENNAGILYHKAPVSVRKSILKNGLIPSVGYSYKAHWDDQDGLKPYVFLYDYNEFGEYDSTYDDDIYAVDTKQLDKTHLNPDPDTHMKGCFVYDNPIPTTAIKLVYKGSRKDSGDLSRHANIYRYNILNEGYWGHLPLQNDSALDEFGEVAYNNIGEQLKNIDKNWDDKQSVFTYLGVIMYMLQIYNFFYSLKSLDKKFDFTNKINKAIKYIDDEKFINEWTNPDEVKEYIKKLPDTIKEILDKNSLDSDNFKKLKVTVPCNEGKNYVNMNVELRKGGRNAVKMSVEDFKQEMIHAYHMYAMEQEAKYKGELQLTPSPGNFVYNLCYNNKLNKKSKYASALYDDIWDGKYKFDSENVDAFGGIKMSKKGFPYIQCDAGGDWECPVCFFVYFDGNKFRGYVPLKGNALNRNEKHAFSGGGNEPDAKFVQKELGLSYEEADHMCDDIDYNVDACLEDFLSRVDVKGTYKKRDYTKDEEKFKAYRKEKIGEEERRREEAERRRQMNAQENNGEPDGSEEINEMVSNILNKFVFEATATGTGGLPGEFVASAFGGSDKDFVEPALDRTPGDTMGMHDRVGKSNVGENKKRKKVVKNDEGKVVPEFCKKCGGKVGTYICGEPIYKCSECGEYYGTVPFTLGRKKK